MLKDMSGLRLWHFPVGGAVLLIICLYQICAVIGEQRDRASVLAYGRDAQARVVQATGLESVLIEWTDEGGRQRTAECKTGKVFARTGLGMTVPIKYDPASIGQPVILPEVPERKRLDAFWFRSSMLVAAGVVAVCAVAVFSLLRAKRMQAGA